MNAPVKEATDLAVVQTLKAEVVFAPGGVEALIERVAAECRAFKADISTKTGRDAIASFAYKVARSKTAIDKLGKDLAADLKKQTAAIDAERRRAWDAIESLQVEVRKPLTDWENADKTRIDAHEKAIAEIQALLDFGGQEAAADQIKARIEALAARPAREWQEFVDKASEAVLYVGKRLEDMHAASVTREAERAELARLRADQVAREQRERDEKIAAEAAERARTEAEAKAKSEADEAAARATAEQQRVEREKAAAEERARKAEADVKAAAERAERDRVAAVEAERKRAADAKAADEAAAAAREADKKHRAKINNEALAAIVAAGASEDIGKAIIAAIAQGKVPHVKISY